MDKKSKVLIGIFMVMVVVSIGITFYRYMILEDINFYTNEEAFNQSLLEE